MRVKILSMHWETNNRCSNYAGNDPLHLSFSSKSMTLADLDAEEIARQSMKIAAEMCVFTNSNWIVETIDLDKEGSSEGSK